MDDIQALIKRFATINDFSEEEAATILGDATTLDEALEKIKQFNLAKIREQNPMPKLNRKQRRALNKKYDNQVELVTDTAEKLNYIDLIQKFRKLNEIREKEDNENSIKDN